MTFYDGMHMEKTETRNEAWVMARRNSNHGLSPLKRAFAQIGDPQKELNVIHVAGTNGKGSTCNYLRDILQAQGYKVGTFTSPHLEEHRDRIRINDVWISEEDFLYYLHKNMNLIETEQLGMFEIDLLIACEYFRDRKTDYVILEAGIGGRLDNTNIIEHPCLEIITTIGFDHMELLGNRIEQIACEKAGIIKHGSVCAVGNIDQRIQKYIRASAHRRQARMVSMPALRMTGAHSFVFMKTEYTVHGASYQRENAALALHAAWLLGVDIHNAQTIQAVTNSFWKGRFEKVHEDPEIYVDGAHNTEAVKQLVKDFDHVKRPLVVVYSALKDKPQKEMAQILRSHCDRLVITYFANARAGTLTNLGIMDADVIADWQKALVHAQKIAGRGTVVVCGSLCFVSMVREIFQ